MAIAFFVLRKISSWSFMCRCEHMNNLAEPSRRGGDVNNRDVDRHRHRRQSLRGMTLNATFKLFCLEVTKHFLIIEIKIVPSSCCMFRNLELKWRMELQLAFQETQLYSEQLELYTVFSFRFFKETLAKPFEESHALSEYRFSSNVDDNFFFISKDFLHLKNSHLLHHFQFHLHLSESDWLMIRNLEMIRPYKLVHCFRPSHFFLFGDELINCNITGHTPAGTMHSRRDHEALFTMTNSHRLRLLNWAKDRRSRRLSWITSADFLELEDRHFL